MEQVFLYIFAAGLFAAGFFLTRKFVSSRNSRVIQKARIDRIELQRLGDMWSPEVLVHYYFAYNRKMYYGSGIMRLDNLLPDEFFLLSDLKGFPVLKTDSGEFAGEEYIETYIIEKKNEILIEFQVFSLPESRIFNIGGEQRPTLQSTDISFPWT